MSRVIIRFFLNIFIYVCLFPTYLICKCSIIFPGEKDIQKGNIFSFSISIVNLISSYWLFMCLRNYYKFSFLCGQMKLFSSKNSLCCFGFNGEVSMAISSNYSMKMFSTTGECGDPIDMSCVCSYMSPRNIKYVYLGTPLPILFLHCL
jgi:hypothetical protein